MRPLATAFVLLGFAGRAISQPVDGTEVHQNPGIALIKPQAWSKEGEATVYEFQEYIDRSSGGAGYYEFHTKADKRQVPVSRLVKVVVYPDPSQFKDVVTVEDRQKLAGAVEELKTVETKFPATRTYVEPSLKKMSDELALFDSGKVKANGAWVSKDSYAADKAANLVSLLKTDVANANPPSSFDFANDPKVLALKEAAATNPKVKAALDSVTQTYNKALRKEKRANLLARLAEPALQLAEAQVAVAQLKTLEPSEDIRSATFLKSWDAGMDTATAATTEAATLAPLMEKELAGFQVVDQPPNFSPNLDKQIAGLDSKLKLFVAGKPAPQLVVASNRAIAVCTVGTGFDKLTTLYADRQYLDAKDVVDEMARQAHLVGPESARVVAALQGFNAGKIKEFTSIREEAKLLADAGKPAEALAKYQAAYEVIPDNGVADLIAKLKEVVPANPKKK